MGPRAARRTARDIMWIRLAPAWWLMVRRESAVACDDRCSTEGKASVLRDCAGRGGDVTCPIAVGDAGAMLYGVFARCLTQSSARSRVSARHTPSLRTPWIMARLHVGVTRYASVANRIAERLGVGGRPECYVGQGRVYVVIRGAGGTRWEPDVQVARALHVAQTAREILLAEPRALARRYAQRAVVVRFEDWNEAAGQHVHTLSECVVPAPDEPTNRGS